MCYKRLIQIYCGIHVDYNFNFFQITYKRLDKKKTLTLSQYIFIVLLLAMHYSEAARGSIRKWRGIGQKGHFCIWPKLNDFMSFTSRKNIFENMESLKRRKWPLQSLYYCKKGIFFPGKEEVHSRNTFFVL